MVGSDKVISALVAKSLSGTCGVVVFQSQTGAEGFIYINGTQPSQVMWGGVTQVMTNPAGGVAIGTSITHPAFPSQFRVPDGWCVLGSERVSSSIFIRGSYTVTGTPVWLPPAIGIMNAQGADIHYLFMLEAPVGTIKLMNGSEADYLAGGGSATAVATIAASGGLSGTYLNWDTVRRDGRSTIGDNWRGFNAPVVIQSAGKSGAIGLVTGDWLGATAIYLDPTTHAVVTTDLISWQTWALPAPVLTALVPNTITAATAGNWPVQIFGQPIEAGQAVNIYLGGALMSTASVTTAGVVNTVIPHQAIGTYQISISQNGPQSNQLAFVVT